MAFTTALLFMLLAAPFVLVSAQTTVEWKLGTSYASYSTQSLKSDGTIVFNYDSTHNVLVVSKSDYENCNSGNPLQTFTDGKSTIPLTQGAMYFICGTPGHCAGGMKLQVNVADGGSTTPATPSTPAIPTPAGSGKTPSPKDSSGTIRLSSAGHLVLGVTLVLGALFAFMS